MAPCAKTALAKGRPDTGQLCGQSLLKRSRYSDELLLGRSLSSRNPLALLLQSCAAHSDDCAGR